jgi:hypothetical protein
MSNMPREVEIEVSTGARIRVMTRPGYKNPVVCIWNDDVMQWEIVAHCKGRRGAQVLVDAIAGS